MSQYMPPDVRRSLSLFKTLFSESRPFLLDIGCGDGRKISVFRDAVSSIVGTDVSIEALKVKASKDLAPVVCRGEHLPFKDSSFEAITCFHVIEHVAERERVLLEVYRVLKKDGWLLLVTPNRRRITSIYSRFLLRLFRPCFVYPMNPDHVFEFTRLDLRILFEHSRFDWWQIEPMFFGFIGGFRGKPVEIGVKDVPKMLSEFCNQWIAWARK